MQNSRTVNRYIRELSHDDASRRRTAATMLADADERAIYPLIKALRDGNPGVQDAAMRSLAAIGGETVAYMVLPLLREDSYLRNTALVILMELGAVSVPFLYSLLADKDDDIRKFALDLMAEIKENVEPGKVVALIRDPNPNVRSAAIRAVGALGYTEGAGAVAEALGDEEWVCFSALETLGEIGGESSVDSIAELLRSKSFTLRLAAMETLGAIGSMKASDALLAHIPTAQADEKSAAVKALVRIGVTPSMSEVGDLLIRMFEEAEWDDKLVALKGIVDLKDFRAIKPIIDIAGSQDTSVPEQEERLFRIKDALRSFGGSGVFAKVLADPEIRYKGKIIAAEIAGDLKCCDAVPHLVELLGRTERDIKRACIRSLGRMLEIEAAMEEVLKAVSDHDGHMRKLAITALGEAGVRKAFDLLLGRLAVEEYDDVLEQTVRALLNIDQDALFKRLEEFPDKVKEAIARYATDVDMLVRLSENPSLDVRVSAISTLGNSPDRKALGRVLEATRDQDTDVRRAAVMALGGMEFYPDDIKPLLEDRDMWVRLHAVRTLGRGLKHGLIETLTPMLEDGEPPVVLAAVEALASIGGKEAFGVLNSLAEHSDESVREAVRVALEKL